MDKMIKLQEHANCYLVGLWSWEEFRDRLIMTVAEYDEPTTLQLAKFLSEGPFA